MYKIRKILIVVLLLLGALISLYGLRSIFNARKCKDWTVVKGRIMDSNITYITDLPNNKTTETSLPDVKYEYVFNNHTYFNQTIAFYGEHTVGLSDSYYAATEDDVLTFLSKYPLNSSVDVYVNPLKPSQSVLDTGLKLPIFMPFLFGILSIFAGFHLYLFGNFYIHTVKRPC